MVNNKKIVGYENALKCLLLPMKAETHKKILFITIPES
jgi:hypothetical protein